MAKAEQDLHVIPDQRQIFLKSSDGAILCILCSYIVIALISTSVEDF